MIESLFAGLLHIRENKAEISLSQALIHNHWQMNDVQIRFIKDFLEQTGIMNKDQQIDLAKIDLLIKEELIRKIDQRNRYKQAKLFEFLQWLTVGECRRSALYQSFQSTIKEAKYHCCDQCGFTLEQWSPAQTKREPELKSWQAQLQSVLLPFEAGGINND